MNKRHKGILDSQARRYNNKKLTRSGKFFLPLFQDKKIKS